mmetsp:Transcript_20122/g.68434  ORF Transcript_20122/g.68434 Transcript_20122/m.68434 type:complete len:273 (-) Transcript_20122:1625-2443(-)
MGCPACLVHSLSMERRGPRKCVMRYASQKMTRMLGRESKRRRRRQRTLQSLTLTSRCQRILMQRTKKSRRQCRDSLVLQRFRRLFKRRERTGCLMISCLRRLQQLQQQVARLKTHCVQSNDMHYGGWRRSSQLLTDLRSRSKLHTRSVNGSSRSCSVRKLQRRLPHRTQRTSSWWRAGTQKRQTTHMNVHDSRQLISNASRLMPRNVAALLSKWRPRGMRGSTLALLGLSSYGSSWHRLVTLHLCTQTCQNPSLNLTFQASRLQSGNGWCLS